MIDDRLENPQGNRGSDILLMFKAKAEMPEKYRELRDGQVGSAVPAKTVINIIVPEGYKAKGQVVEGESRPVEKESDAGATGIDAPELAPPI